MRLRVLALVACWPGTAAAQEVSRCSIDGGPQTSILLPSGQRNVFMGGGVVVRCPSKSLTLRADSLESYGDDGRVYMLGDVDYQEPRLSIKSDFLTYFQRDERIVANGNVDATLPSGSTMRGPYAEYYRAIPGTRPATRLFANGRPTFNIVQEDTAGGPPDTLVVLANNVTMIGDSLVYAGGAVRATRPEVEARGDSMTLDSEAEHMVMMRNPEIEGKGDRRFTLSGNRIELTSRQRQLERVISIGRAKAVSDSMTLTSDTMDLRVAKNMLQRTIAWGPSRARANSPTQRLVADSIDVVMPGQRIREMHAVRGALAEGKPDSVRFRADTTDWLNGDTVIARFDTVVTADSANPKLRQLVATGRARAYYHLNPADSAARRPAINYVTGREIVIAFDNQQVSRVTVVNQAAGVYLEPRAETARDTAAARPATTRPPANPAPGNRPPATRPPAAQPAPVRPPE